MSKDINNKNKRGEEKVRRRINPFDVIIVILLLCLLGTLGYRVYDGIAVEKSGNDSKYILEFECDGVYNSISDYLKKDTAVYLSDGQLLGYVYADKGSEGVSILEKGSETLESAESVEAETESVETGTDELEDTDTSFVYEKVALRGRIKLSTDTVAVKNGGYYSIGGNNFAVGSVIEVHTDKAVFTLKIVAIESID